ncbi:MAG: alpha/beta fold hydrolase [Chthoniobacterales bacterium]
MRLRFVGIFKEKSKRKKALSVGLGVGLAGGALLALRYGFRQPRRTEIPDSLSPAIFASRIAATSLGEMVYHTSGAGEPMVFLHGVYPGASSYEWSKVYAHFADSHEVIAPDLIGFGESQRPKHTLDAAEYAQSLVEFLHEVCGGRKAILVSSGVGAQFAFLLASQHPELFSRMICWLPMGLASPLRRNHARQILGIGRLPLLRSFVWRNYLSKPQFVRSWLSEIGFSDPNQIDPKTVRVLSLCASLSGAECAIWAFLRGHLSANLSGRLENFPIPTTIFWPEESELFSEKEILGVMEKLPQAQLRKIHHHGILAPLAAPDYFIRLIDESLGLQLHK